MIQAYPSAQLGTVDAGTSPQNNILAQTKGLGLQCSNGVLMQDVTLAAGSANVALAFPSGVTTAVYIFIFAITTTDLIVKIGSSPVSCPVPYGMPTFFYGWTSAQISLSTVLGGQVQYSVGG